MHLGVGYDGIKDQLFIFKSESGRKYDVNQVRSLARPSAELVSTGNDLEVSELSAAGVEDEGTRVVVAFGCRLVILEVSDMGKDPNFAIWQTPRLVGAAP